jgi:hypothetical protein
VLGADQIAHDDFVTGQPCRACAAAFRSQPGGQRIGLNADQDLAAELHLPCEAGRAGDTVDVTAESVGAVQDHRRNRRRGADRRGCGQQAQQQPVRKRDHHGAQPGSAAQPAAPPA